MEHLKPVIGITMGDPSGIGPEIISKILAQDTIYNKCKLILFGDVDILKTHFQKYVSDVFFQEIYSLKEVTSHEKTVFVTNFLKIKNTSYTFGKVNLLCGKFAYNAVCSAVEWHMKGWIDAIVTAPLSKEALNQAGYLFSGHTDLLGYLTNTKNYKLLLSSEKLKVIHTTMHLSLKDACEQITKENVFKTILLGYEHLKQLRYKNPKIGVCGLNPHAGENGLFGKEELEEVIPAIQQAKRQGIDVEGPIPGDVIFKEALKGGYDLIVAQYHDQGHIPVKMIAFDSAVNVTLGLPIIRTSVDHGTAHDISGKDTADPTNLSHAIEYALQLIPSFYGKT